MVRQKKCVLGCKEKKTLFSFPTNPDVRQRWMQFIFPGQKRKCEWIYVCSLHFEDNCFTNKAQFDAGFANRLQLIDEAVPTLKDSVQESEPQVIVDNSCLLSSGQFPAIKSMTLQTPEGMQAKSKNDRQHAKTTIDIGEAFPVWRTFREENGFRSDAELAFYLLKRLRDEDLSVRSKKRRLETLTDVPALQAKESERNSSQSSQDRQSTDKDEDMEVAEICYEVPFPSQTDELAKTELKSSVQIKLEEQARSVDQLKTEDQLKSAVQIKLEEQARSVDQLKTEDQIKLEEQARSVDQLKTENQIKLGEQARSVDQLKTENQIKLEEQARSVDQLKSAVQIKLEEQARSVDQLKTEDQLKPENQIKLKEQARSEDQLKSSVQIKLEEQARSQDQLKTENQIKLEEQARSEDQLKTENQIKLEEQARSEDQLKTEDQIKSEVQIKSEDQLNEDFCNGFVAPSLGNEDPRISTSTTKKEIKEEPVETEVQPENRIEISMDSVTTSDKITPNFVQTVNPVTVQVKERLVPNFTGLLRTCFQCGEPVQECTTGSSGSLNQLQWKCSNGHRIFLFSNSNLTQTHTQLS
nr:probable serine/threonine-protein kinase kinX isoform X2 [Misgurnus anguillicaudatus]